MANHYRALIAIATGIVFFVSGVYGLAIGYFALLPIIGIVLIILGLVLLVLASRPISFCVPHVLVIIIVLPAIALQVYIWGFKSSGDLSIRSFPWALMPYALCVLLSIFAPIRTPIMAGSAVALLFDIWAYYEVLINPQCSTSVLSFIYVPLWNTVIWIPLATFVAWKLSKGRGHRLASP